jgi:hypothetical protein
MGRLRNRRSFASWNDDSKPMDGVSNLSDAMLVFACGLMISVAVNWKVDLAVQQVEVSSEQLVDQTDFNEVISGESNEETYKEMGKVYVDSDTGEMYMVVD